MAGAFHRLVEGRGIVHNIVLTPLGVPATVAGAIFTYLFGSTGYTNEVLSRLGIINTLID